MIATFSQTNIGHSNNYGQHGQIERKWDLITKISNLMISTPLDYKMGFEIERNIGEKNEVLRNALLGFPLP